MPTGMKPGYAPVNRAQALLRNSRGWEASNSNWEASNFVTWGQGLAKLMGNSGDL
jgi:hypothetical protein